MIKIIVGKVSQVMMIELCSVQLYALITKSETVLMTLLYCRNIVGEIPHNVIMCWIIIYAKAYWYIILVGKVIVYGS